jgi:hypothetical protein
VVDALEIARLGASESKLVEDFQLIAVHDGDV